MKTIAIYGVIGHWKGVKFNIPRLVKFVDRVPVLSFGGIGSRCSMVYIGNLYDMIDKLCKSKLSGTFLTGDDRPISTTSLLELIVKIRGRKVVFLNIPLFPQLLKTVKPWFSKRLYESLEVDNSQIKKVLGFENRVSTEDGIRKMVEGIQ